MRTVSDSRWKRALSNLRIRHRGVYALKDTFVTETLRIAEETGNVEKLMAWLVRQTGARLDTLRQHYEKWWPRDQHAIAARYTVLDPQLNGRNQGKLQPGRLQIGKNP